MGPSPSPTAMRFLPVTQREPRCGAWPNYYLALTELLMREPEADAYFLVQDDVNFYDRINLREYLESILWPSDPAPPISLYSCLLDAPPQLGWHPHHKPWFRGTLALIFHPETVRQFLVDPVVFGHRWNPRNDGLLHVDTVVGEWAYRNGRSVQHPNPSLCQHIGATSTLWPHGKVEHDRIEGLFGEEALLGTTLLAQRGEFPEAAFPCPELHRNAGLPRHGRSRPRADAATHRDHLRHRPQHREDLPRVRRAGRAAGSVVPDLPRRLLRKRFRRPDPRT